MCMGLAILVNPRFSMFCSLCNVCLSFGWLVGCSFALLLFSYLSAYYWLVIPSSAVLFVGKAIVSISWDIQNYQTTQVIELGHISFITRLGAEYRVIYCDVGSAKVRDVAIGRISVDSICHHRSS